MSIQDFFQQRGGGRRTRNRPQNTRSELILFYKVIATNGTPHKNNEPDSFPITNECIQSPIQIENDYASMASPNGSPNDSPKVSPYASPNESSNAFANASANPSKMSSPVVTSLSNVSTNSNKVRVRFNSSDSITTLESWHDKDEKMGYILQNFKEKTKKAIDFLDSSGEPFDSGSMDYPLGLFLITDENSLDIYWHENTSDNSSSPTGLLNQSKTMSGIAVMFSSRSEPTYSFQNNYKRSTPIYDILNECANDIGQNLNNIVFFKENSELLEPSNKPLELHLGLDALCLKLEFELEGANEWKKKPAKRSRKNDDTYSLEFKDRRNINSDLDLPLNGSDHLLKAIDELIDVMDLDRTISHFFDSNGKKNKHLM